MAAKDYFHDTVKTALVKEGWQITHDPLYLDFDSARVQIDLAGEKLIAAERDLEKIAVEVKSFLAPSTIYEFHLAVGQCFSYRVALRQQEPERKLYLAIPLFTYQEFVCRPFAQTTLEEANLNILVFDPNQEVIVQWKK
ncbi:element excision factor XisH family protein [Roseofilum capinflatum]|uniref:Element excision factor XisH family protein n=1 Tax=Roseofilum capinflatum BLCC-M114 TaxID=3022440 RepID=A0ABT7B8G8_9CYAN|nr:element excision factor XisH family protein [Roseofilum capinflatum]MDJ1175464.1 element excision factor XisH family protein [Roseofilum capinflatum BLCC-M114]